MGFGRVMVFKLCSLEPQCPMEVPPGNTLRGQNVGPSESRGDFWPQIKPGTLLLSV